MSMLGREALRTVACHARTSCGSAHCVLSARSWHEPLTSAALKSVLSGARQLQQARRHRKCSNVSGSALYASTNSSTDSGEGCGVVHKGSS